MNTSGETTYDDEILALRQHLISSLKFHHRVTLQNIPLEAVVRATTSDWDACHPEDFPEYCTSTLTAIIPMGQISNSIR